MLLKFTHTCDEYMHTHTHTHIYIYSESVQLIILIDTRDCYLNLDSNVSHTLVSLNTIPKAKSL